MTPAELRRCAVTLEQYAAMGWAKDEKRARVLARRFRNRAAALELGEPEALRERAEVFAAMHAAWHGEAGLGEAR